MDAFVTRTSSVGPSRTTDGSTKRLPPSDAIPSFFGAAGKPYERVSSHADLTGKGKARASTEGLPSVANQVVNKHGESSKRAQSVPAAHSTKLKQAVINITKSLKSADNPVTHSSAYSGAFHYVSCSSGHQTSNGKLRTAMNDHMLSRNAKLKAQGAKAQTGVFAGVKAYINGTTMPAISNLDLIRLIQENGGDVRYAFSKTGCTHIICVHGLSSQKTHKELNGRSRTKIVTPAWVLDSISAGKKLAETKYKILESETQSSIRTAFTTCGTSGSLPIKADSSALTGLDVENVDDDGFARLPSPLPPSPKEDDEEEVQAVTISDSEDNARASPEEAILISSSQ